ncbi:Serine carboxypeptidase-like 2 [Morella rubra]|uniref:Serine carboxypeptidase-like 2 n=1 Tax=Morella rubra TaxID=262757 RepID=A0A6A1UUN4_9ROSI|nr:Serine carboxypeptidase-like 2 [Morella rubra]
MAGSLFRLSLCFRRLVVTLLLLLQVCSQHAVSRSMVKFLPGFQGPLPFELETGYVGVDESEDVQLFYYFVKSERNSKVDPLLLWLTGGPGCSAWSGLVYEIGPLNYKVQEYNGSLPELVVNPYSWTKASSVIFVDSPVGTGFSYARTPEASLSGVFKQVNQLHQFLTKWLIDHPEFVSNPVYVGGDSYSGIPIPVLVQEISNGIEEGIAPLINLQGFLLGNAVTDPRIEGNAVIPYAHGMGIISDELYETLKRTCGGEYVNIDPSNAECLKDILAFDECLSGINTAQILEPLCIFASPKPHDVVRPGKRRSLYQNLQVFQDPDLEVPPLGCRSYGYLLSRYWANDDEVRKALQIRKGSIGEWQRCSYGLRYTQEIESSYEYHVNLSIKGYRSLIYSGDHDIAVPFLGTQAWIRSLNYSIVNDWRPWIVRGQIAGVEVTQHLSTSLKNVLLCSKGGRHTNLCSHLWLRTQPKHTQKAKKIMIILC